MAHGAAHDAAQHIAATLIGRQHAIGHQEGRTAEVVRHDAVAGAEGAVGVLPGGFRAGQDQGAQRVGVVVVVFALQDGSEAFEPHAGVYRRAGQRDTGAGGTFLELHEHEVPDFDEAVPVLIRATGRAARDVVAVIVEDFAARAAGAGVAHAPEIVRGRDADNAAIRQACDLLPDDGGFLVFRIDGDQQAGFIEAEILGQQFPGIGDGGFFKIVAEAEIAQHFEEGVVPGGVADIVQIVVLATGAHGFLGRGGAGIGPLFLPGEHVLELDHARIREHQRRVVPRHEGGAFHHLVPIAGEILEEGSADIVAAGHDRSSGSRVYARKQSGSAAWGRSHAVGVSRCTPSHEGRGRIGGSYSAASAVSLSSGLPSIMLVTTPDRSRTFTSMVLAISLWSRRNCLAFSRPWPRRWLS